MQSSVLPTPVGPKNKNEPIYGARPLKRAIQQEIENSLAQQVLSGQLLPGKVVTVDYVDGKVQARQ